MTRKKLVKQNVRPHVSHKFQIFDKSTTVKVWIRVYVVTLCKITSAPIASAHLEHDDRSTNQPATLPTSRHEGSLGSYTSNKGKAGLSRNLGWNEINYFNFFLWCVVLFLCITSVWPLMSVRFAWSSVGWLNSQLVGWFVGQLVGLSVIISS